MKKPKDVDEYISSAPIEIRGKLEELRETIKKCAPLALEKISYGMPYYGYKGRLAYFAYAKEHVGLYIMPKVLADFPKEIARYKTGKATLRFNLNEKLPLALIRKLVKQGIKKNEGK